MRLRLSIVFAAAAGLALPLSVAAAPTTQVAREEDRALRPLRGTVLDAMDAPIAGARVTIVDDGQSSRETQGSGPSAVTDQRGEFTLTLSPGHYILRVAA